MNNGEIATIFGFFIKIEFLLLIVFGICAVWSPSTNFSDDLGIWGKLIITDVILLVASLIFFINYDTRNPND